MSSSDTTHKIDTDAEMLTILALDPGAHLCFSVYTRRWYVNDHLETGGDGFLASICTHADTPQQAIHYHLNELKSIEFPLYIVRAAPWASRTQWRWNGAAFMEVPA